MNRFSRLIVTSVLFVSFAACTVDYGKVMSRKITAALGAQFNEYQSFTYPTSNYGLSTAYTPQSGRDIPSDRDFLCDMWSCIGIEDAEIPMDPKAQLAMNGFAAVGTGGTITLTETEQREIASNVALPEIYSVVNVSGGFQKNQVTETTMTIGPAHARQLRRKVMSEYISKLPATDPMKRAFDAGTLVLVIGDVVVDSLKVDIKVTNTAKPALDAALGKDVPGGAGKVFSSAKISVKMSSAVDGRYTFNIDRPIIVKRLLKRQPGAGVLGNALDDAWTDWDAVGVAIPK